MYRKNVYSVCGKKQNNFWKHEILHPKRGVNLIWNYLQSTVQRDQRASWVSDLLSLDWPENKIRISFFIYFFLNKHMLLVLPSCPFHFITCCDTLDTEEPLRFRESPWQTVSKELGRIERKSLKDRRRTVSLSSFVDSKGTTGRGNSLDSNGSSVLLYRPNALATPSKVGTVYLHRYSVQEKE